MSDLVVVMHRAPIAQAGTPRSLYESPASVFAADFLGEIEPYRRHDHGN